MFDDLKRYLLAHNISKVLVACTNCYKVFKNYGDDLTVVSAYEELDRDFPPPVIKNKAPVTIHDPCAVRFDATIHNAVRSLISKTGLEIQEMEHTRERPQSIQKGETKKGGRLQQLGLLALIALIALDFVAIRVT